MFTKLKQKLSTGDNKKIASNFIYLSIVQGANFLLPLLTFPYLVRVLGIDKFGLIMFAQAFMVYFSMMADYGFNLSGTREISTHRDNLKRVEQIFSSIMLARFGLIAVGFVIMNIIVFSFEKFAVNWLLYYLTYAMVVGTALFPIWFFQGMEKMKYITILSLVAKLFFTLSVFGVVHNPDDYIYVPLLNSLGYVSVGLLSLWVIRKDFGVTIKLQKWEKIVIQLKRGWHIFISKISINLYTATNTFLLGIFTNDTTVGYYAIAEKVVRIITSVFAPFYQAIYPHIVQLMNKSKSLAFSFLINSSTVIFVISLLLAMFTYYFSDTLLLVAFGNDSLKALDTFIILIPLIVINPISSMIYNVLIMSLKKDLFLSMATIFGAIINILMIIFLFNILNSKLIAVSYSLLTTEFILMCIGLWMASYEYLYMKWKI